MSKNISAIIYVAAMALTVIAVDVAFFRDHTGPRLAVNIGIILVFASFYWRFFKH
jgi:hypothetical protein